MNRQRFIVCNFFMWIYYEESCHEVLEVEKSQEALSASGHRQSQG